MGLSDKFKKAIARHVAGATVSHKSPFLDLSVPETRNSLNDAFLAKYVAPFYMSGIGESEYLESYKNIQASINQDVIFKLLTEYNWRNRQVGATFAAIENYTDFEEHIGKLLLRSDVCYAGHSYCIYLASCNTTTSTELLTRYLDYYLTKPDLWFDQGSAMSALAYLDEVNKTKNLDQYMQAWAFFVKNKSNWNLEQKIKGFSAQMQQLPLFQKTILP